MKLHKTWSAYDIGPNWYVWDTQGCDIPLGQRAKTKANKLANYLNKNQIDGKSCNLNDVCKQFTQKTGITI